MSKQTEDRINDQYITCKFNTVGGDRNSARINIDMVSGYIIMRFSICDKKKKYRMELLFSKMSYGITKYSPEYFRCGRTKKELEEWYMENIEKRRTVNVLLNALDLLPLSAGSEFLKSMQTIKEKMIDKNE